MDDVRSLEASLENTKYFAAVSLSVLLYEHLTTLDDEIRHFWHRSLRGNFSSTTALFLLIRYCSLATVSIIAYYLRANNLSTLVCGRLYTTIIFMWFACIFTVQVLQTLKLWYLLTLRLVRHLVIASFAIAALSSAVLISFHLASPEFPAWKASTRASCISPYVSWTLFAPSYAFSLSLLLWMIIVTSTSGTTIGTPLLREFVASGSLVYSITFAIISSSMGVLLAYASGNLASASIGLPAIISISLTITSLTISRCLVQISLLLDACANNSGQRDQWIKELEEFKRANRNTRYTEVDGFSIPENMIAATPRDASSAHYSLVDGHDDIEDSAADESSRRGYPASSEATPGNSVKSIKESDFVRASELSGLSYLRRAPLEVSARVYSFLLGYEPVKYQGN